MMEKPRFRWVYNGCSHKYQWVAVNQAAIEWATLRHDPLSMGNYARSFYRYYSPLVNNRLSEY